VSADEPGTEGRRLLPVDYRSGPMNPLFTVMSQPTTPPVEEPAWLTEPPVSDVTEELPAWYKELQADAWKRFESLPTPSRFDEPWRFADLKKVRFAALQPLAAPRDPGSIIARAQHERLEHFAAHFVFLDNTLIHAETPALPEGAIVLPFNQALERHGDLVRDHFLQEERSLGGDKFAALHASATLSGLFVHFPSGCRCEWPILTHHFSSQELAPTFPHTLIVADGHSEVTVFETFESADPAKQTLTVGMTDLIAQNGASVQYVCFQDAGDDNAKHVQLNNTVVGKDARVKSAFINLGAAWVRTESINRMVAEGADSQVFAANLATGIQEYDQRTLQCHEAQHTTSDLLFKNALYDQSRTIFGGLIQVLPGAHHTDSYQTCRNLLGSEQAEANSMPGLEIDADQVKCSHGATTGQISDEEIFYLCARGISPEIARQMISFGFLNEVVQRLNGDELKAHLAREIDIKFRELLEAGQMSPS